MAIIQEMPPMSAQRNDGLLQMVEQNDEKHEAGHHRLRADLNSLQEDTAEGFHRLTTKYNSLEQRLSRLENTPTNIEKLMLTPRFVITMIVFAVTIAGGVWGASYNARSDTAALRSDVRDILTRMEAKQTLDQANRQLDQERAKTQSDAIVEMRKRIELLEFVIRDSNPKPRSTK